MCGIIGIIANRNVVPLLLAGLYRLEYRGYDSAGIATGRNGQLSRVRVEGKIKKLEKALAASSLSGSVGIGHTRWATHGVASESNAHPHMTEKVAIVHNGIIDNYRELFQSIGLPNTSIESDTDTEILAHILTFSLDAGKTPLQAVQDLLPKLKGSFALCMLFAGHEKLMIGVKMGSPLALGFGRGERYFASDALSLSSLTQDICHLHDGDCAIIDHDTVQVFDSRSQLVNRPLEKITRFDASIGKGNFRHFMLKEICEQPTAIGNTLTAFLDPLTQTTRLPGAFDSIPMDRLVISACGTSYHAALVAKHWAEELLQLPVEVDVASELRYRKLPVGSNTFSMFISQSGETMDTLAALKSCKSRSDFIVSIVNTLESAIARESDSVLQTLAGPEIGVASTKVFTTQLVVLLCSILFMARIRGTLSIDKERCYVRELIKLPALVTAILHNREQFKVLAKNISQARHVLFLGRGIQYPVALEGALKLKEVSYIHAEGYAAGELKHGPMALVEDNMPIVVTCPGTDELFYKMTNTVREVLTRGGKIILFSDAEGIDSVKELQSSHFVTVEIPKVSRSIAPMVYVIPLQLLAYYCAVHKGTDVDQPRNLAKSVTVD